MISQGSFHRIFKTYKNLFVAVKEQQNILSVGLGEYKNILQWWLPILLAIMFFILCGVLSTRLARMINSLIAILPSLTGFLIASATILISINSKTISSKPKNCLYSYSQVGGAIFFKCIKLSIYLLVFAFLTPESLPSALIAANVTLILPTLKFCILLLFSKLLIMMLYGLLFLSSAIES